MSSESIIQGLTNELRALNSRRDTIQRAFTKMERVFVSASALGFALGLAITLVTFAALLRAPSKGALFGVALAGACFVAGFAASRYIGAQKKLRDAALAKIRARIEAASAALNQHGQRPL
jgi:Na+/melibiose symporter-like transporter